MNSTNKQHKVMRYRIKIEERNNGETRFIPQAVYGKIIGGWNKRFRLKWENIIANSYYGSPYTSSLMSEAFDSEEKALEIIEKYKEYLLLEEGRVVNKVSYKGVE